ncbi:MAG: hypothetical protein AABZ77_00815, partial [Chloroflexota bacterium]
SWVATSSLGLLGSSTVSSLTTNYLPKWGGSTFSNSVMYENSSKIGIGTSTPNWLLQVSGTRPSIALSDTAASANLKHWLLSSMGGNLYLGTSTDSYGTSTPAALTILNSGNIGVGTSTPGTLFSVGSTGGLNINSSGTITGGSWNGTVIGDSYLTKTGDWTGTIDGNNFAGGAIGPGDLLYGLSAGVITELASSTDGKVLQLGFGSGAPSWVATSSLGLLGSSTVSSLTTNYLPKWTGSVFANSAIYDSSGLVGIGTSSPWAKLSVAGSSLGTIPVFTISTSTASATSTAFIIDSNGKVGIGTSSPYQQLSISGNLALTGGFYDSTASAGTANYILKSTGSATQWVATSSLFTAGIDSLPSGSAGQTLTYQNSAWTATSTLTVLANGLVGIGT